MRNLIYIAAISVICACNAGKKITMAELPQGFDKEGHRGCRGLMPENTIPAMLRALDLGVTTLEMDAHITADKRVVVSHDPYFNDLITTTPEGTFLKKPEAQQRLLYTMTYDSIRKYDVGLKPHPDFPHQQKIAAYKPLLADLIDSTEGYRNNQPPFYNIEIKSKPETDGKRHPGVEEFVDLVMKVVQEKKIVRRTVIQSFDARALQVMHRKYPRVATSFLVEPTDKGSLSDHIALLGFVPDIYSPNSALVTASLVKECHEKRIRIVPWTVNTIEAMRKLKALGVDGIISDYPDLFSQL